MLQYRVVLVPVLMSAGYYCCPMQGKVILIHFDLVRVQEQIFLSVLTQYCTLCME